ncbi:MAG: DUF362 domain-containing protein [Candidatus Omnitrophica bacterium]|nr:DUF362 domain-containing protein [Candidatus Omnitrophota bacterium]
MKLPGENLQKKITDNRVSLVKCGTYDPQQVQQAVRAAMEHLGGLSRFVRPASSVLIKPNLLMAKGPETGIVTHPQVVRAVIRLLKEQNCRIFVGDGPSVWGRYIEDVDTVYQITGIKAVCEEEDVELVKFESRRWHGKFPLSTWLDTCNHVINIPKFKTHDLTLLTGAVKNLYGLVSGTFKTELHKAYYRKEEFSKVLLDIYEDVKPSLTIVDGITALEGDGPATRGLVREAGILVAGSDCVAIDMILARIMGIDPKEVMTIREAKRRGVGSVDFSDIEIAGESLEDINTRPFILPSTSLKKNLPQWLVGLATQMIRYYPQVNHRRCIKCCACVQACPMKIIRLRDGRITIDLRKCIACFCCQEVCPSAAIFVKKSWFARAIGL